MLKLSIFNHLDPQAFRMLILINGKLELIMANQAELEVSLAAIKDQLVKASIEIQARIAALILAVEQAGATTPGVDAAVAGLKNVAQMLDDINPDGL